MRLLNRPLALILAVALAGASIILIIEVIALAVHASPVVVHWPTWYRWAGKTHWNALVIRVWSAILIVIGALILAVELKPRRVTRLRLHTDDDATDAALTRSGLARTLRAAATGVDGISAAAVTVRRRRARVAARSAPAAGPPPTRSSSPSPRRSAAISMAWICTAPAPQSARHSRSR